MEESTAETVHTLKALLASKHQTKLLGACSYRAHLPVLWQ